MQGQSIDPPSNGPEPTRGTGAGQGSELEVKEVAPYICDMTGHLKTMALSADLNFLAYLIDMAHIEAFNVVNAQRLTGDKKPDR